MTDPNKNRHGYKKTKVGWIPEDWKDSRLGEICSMKSGVTITSKSIYEKAEYRCFGGNGLRGFTTTFTHDGEFVLIGRQGALCGNVHLVLGKFYASEHAIVTTVSKAINPLWLAESLRFKKLNRHTESSAQPGLSVSKVLRMRIPLPPLPEQEAIAGVLECWDRAIRGYEKKIEKKRNVKKGLMKALLSGKIRLPGFGTTENTEGHGKRKGGILEGWKEVRLGELCSLSKEKYQPNEQEDLKCLELEHIEKGTGRIIGYTSSSAQSSMKTRFKPGSILFGKLRPYLQKFARPQFAGVCSTEIWALLPNEREVSGDFLFWLVQSGRFNAAANVTSGSKMPRADWRHLSSCVFWLPAICEQQGMASLLSAVDAEISALECKLALLRDQKRFLLNNLVTGSLRLPEFATTENTESHGNEKHE